MVYSEVFPSRSQLVRDPGRLVVNFIQKYPFSQRLFLVTAHFYSKRYANLLALIGVKLLSAKEKKDLSFVQSAAGESYLYALTGKSKASAVAIQLRFQPLPRQTQRTVSPYWAFLPASCKGL